LFEFSGVSDRFLQHVPFGPVPHKRHLFRYAGLLHSRWCGNCYVCAACGEGTFSVGPAISCIPCPANTYSAATSATSKSTCTACPQYTSSLQGASICECAAGTSGVGIDCLPCRSSCLLSLSPLLCFFLLTIACVVLLVLVIQVLLVRPSVPRVQRANSVLQAHPRVLHARRIRFLQPRV